jgi:hypothetical protein
MLHAGEQQIINLDRPAIVYASDFDAEGTILNRIRLQARKCSVQDNAAQK